MGYSRTKEFVARRFFWPGMSSTIKEYLHSCPVCQRIKAPRHRPFRHLGSLPVPKGLWQDLSMDFITGLPASQGYDAIWVVVNRFTKMAHYIPTNKTIIINVLVNMLIRDVVYLHKVPKSIISNKGSIFMLGF